MILAAATGGNPEMLRVVQRRGIDLNSQNNDGETALMRALKNRSYRFMIALVEAGADINIKNNEGKTVIDMAEEMGLHEKVELINKALERRKQKLEKQAKRAAFKAKQTAQGKSPEGKRPVKRQPKKETKE